MRVVAPSVAVTPSRRPDLQKARWVEPSAPAGVATLEATGEAMPSWVQRALAAVGKVLPAVMNGVRSLIFGPQPSFDEQLKNAKLLEDLDTRDASPAQLEAARAQLASRAAAEQAALAKLGARAEGYRRLAGFCQNDPVARAALQTMLLDGRLEAKALRGGEAMLTHLDRLATGALAPGLDRADLLTNLIEELEHPAKMSQEQKNSCAATSSTILLTERHPAEYARLIAELARPEGLATLANGKSIQREADWNADNDGNRTPSVRLLQPALMEYANPLLGYDNTGDYHWLPKPLAWGLGAVAVAGAALWRGGGWLGRLELAGAGAFVAFNRMFKGLTSGQTARALEGLTGEAYGSKFVHRFNRDGVWKDVEAAVAAGKTVPVGVNYFGIGGHQILLTGLKDGFAYYTNPWGTKERMAIDVFKQTLLGANLPGR